MKASAIQSAIRTAKSVLKTARAAVRKADRAIKAAAKPDSVILHEDSTRVVIATGINDESDNTKTGGMIQVWILYRHESPNDAVKSGSDAEVCGDCKHRGYIDNGKLVERRCYVNVGQAPGSIWRAYQRGVYRMADASEYQRLFGGRLVRFGAYGDPYFVPLSIVAAIVAVARDWTAYTHQWQSAGAGAYRPYVMASVDSQVEADKAAASGWRYFRVRTFGDMSVSPGEIRCPAAPESNYRSQCANCRLCNGTKYGDSDPRKNITILDHSPIKRTQPMLIQIGQ